ncbi:hypothetical protein GQ53DRAFT_756497 [Thozetella sp. PMI_491]|nr:hypothetical protein GQ53DRAFT_756497 [Thozetella sp. PMI_491]
MAARRRLAATKFLGKGRQSCCCACIASRILAKLPPKAISYTQSHTRVPGPSSTFDPGRKKGMREGPHFACPPKFHAALGGSSNLAV